MSGIWDELVADAPTPEDVERRQQVAASQTLVATQPAPVPAPQPPSWADLTDGLPATQELLADPARAAAVQGDITRLAAVERVFGGWRDIGWETAQAWRRGRASSRLAEIGYAQRQGRATPELLAEAERLEAAIAAAPAGRQGFIPGIPAAVAESLPMMLGSAWSPTTARRMSEAGTAGLAAGAAAGSVIPGVGTATGGVKGALVGLGVGLRGGMTEEMARREAGLAYREYMAIPGVTHEAAAFASDLVGIANGLLEILPLDAVLQVPALKSFLRGAATRDLFRRLLGSNTGRAAVARAAARLAGGFTVEGLTEAAQEFSTILGGELIDGEEGVSIDWDRVLEAGVKGGQGGLGMSALGVGAGLVTDVREARAGYARERFWTDLAAASAASETRAKAPDAFHAHVAAVVDKTGAPEAVLAPAEALTEILHQNDITLEQVAQTMPTVARQLEEAAGNPTVEISIPMADFATRIAPLKGFEQLVPDLRVGDELTLREKRKVAEDAAKLKDEMKATEGVPDAATPAQRVVRDVAAKLEAAGVDGDSAAQQAALWGAFARVMAERTGAADAWAFYETIGLEVQRQDVAPGEDVKTGTPAAAAQETTLAQRFDLAGLRGPQEPAPAAGAPGAPAAPERAPAAVLDASGIAPEPGDTTLAQKGGEKVTRGHVRFNESRTRFVVTLTQNANLSTFLHETGHVFLEILRRSAKAPGAPASLKADLATLEKELGIPIDGNWTEDQLERFARGFERYLMEGKAPSSALADVFRSFKAWLRWIYRQFSFLDVQLSDEVRGVMDRLLATDAEIAAAREEEQLFPAYDTPDAAGMSEAAFREYRERYERAVEAAREQAEAEALLELRRGLGAERERVQEEVTEASRQDRAFNAREFLRTGKRLDGAEVPPEIAGKKLDRAALEGLALEPDVLRRARFYAVKEGGIDPDVLAPYLGFASGDELVAAIASAPPRAEWIRAEVQRRMEELYPEAKLAATAAKVQKALHEDVVAEALLTELDVENRRVGTGEHRRSAAAVLQRAARDRVAEMTEIEMDAARYRRAAAREAREHVKAVAKRDFRAAREHKRLQLWNFYVAREVAQAKAEVEKIREHAAKFDDIRVRKRIGLVDPKYLDGIDAIREGVGFKRVSAKAVAKRISLAKWVAEREAAGDVVGPALKETAELKSYREMTLSELRSVHAALSNIEAMARLKGKLQLKKEKRELARTAAQLAEHIRTNIGAKRGPSPGDLTKLQKAREFLRSADAQMKKIEFICKILDGGKIAGLAHQLIFQPLRDAQNERYVLQDQVFSALLKPFDALTLERRARYAKHVTFLHSPKTGKPVRLSRRNVLSIALNMGNEGNRTRLLEGYGWTEEQVLARLDQLLDDEDIAIVEHIWKSVDSLWPRISALSERWLGIPPKRVEATPFTLPGGRKLSGGYYPIVKSRRLSYLGRKIAEQKNALMEMQTNFLAPFVEHGFTESRGNDMSPLDLSLDAVPAHLDSVIHYLTHYEAIRAVDQLTQHPDVRAAITEGLGAEYYGQIRPWLANIASEGTTAEPLVFYERIFRSLRFGSSVVLLFAKIPTALKQALGLATSGGMLKKKHLVSGVRRFLREGWAEVREESPEFKYIDKQLDRDARELFASLDASFSELGRIRGKVVEFSAMPIMLVQKSVNAITWYAAREQALEEGHPDPRAYADSVVTMTQTGGGAKDLAAIQRGGELRKMFTVMFTYRSVLYNLLSEQQLSEKARWQKATELTARLFWYVLLPVVIEQILFNGIGEDEEPDDVVKRVALEAALTPVRTVPFVGDLPEAAIEQRVPRIAPWIDTTYRVAVAAGKSAEGEMSKSDARAVADFVGMVTQLPTGALWTYGTYLDQLLSGELEEPVQDLLLRNPSKWE